MHCATGDFDGFRRIATGFLDQYGKDGVILVADRDGRQVFSSVTTDTASLPPRNNRDIVEKVFATKKPAILQPVHRRGEEAADRDGRSAGAFATARCVYDISFSPPIEIFQAMIEQQRPSQDWTISIFDGEGINFARVPNPQETDRQARIADAVCGDVPRTRKPP